MTSTLLGRFKIFLMNYDMILKVLKKDLLKMPGNIQRDKSYTGEQYTLNKNINVSKFTLSIYFKIE